MKSIMFKKYEEWMGPKIKNLTVWDMKLLKMAVFAFTLMLAKFFPVLLGLEWYWYALVGTLAMIPLAKKVFM